MKSLALLVSAFLITGGVKAQLMIKNTQPDTVQIAVVMRYDTKEFKGWVSKGWYRLSPGDSGSVGALTGASVYYYLQTTDNKKKVIGNRQFLVDPKDPFNINNADAKKEKEAHSNYEWREFYEVKVPEKAIKDSRLLILL